MQIESQEKEDDHTQSDDYFSDERLPVRGDSPEPPARYNRNMTSIPPKGEIKQVEQTHSNIDSIRRMISSAQIMAFISLVIGGVILSSISVMVAIVAYRSARNNLEKAALDYANTAQGLRRSAIFAVVLGLLALAVNAIALITIYPMLIDSIQSNDYTSLWGDATPPAKPEDSFW